MSILASLNYMAIIGYKTWELLGFAELEIGSKHIGLKLGTIYVTALKLSKQDTGWGDSDPSPQYSKEYPWVVLAMGIDDESYYTRFTTEEGARAFADCIIEKGKVNIFDKSIWFYQN